MSEERAVFIEDIVATNTYSNSSALVTAPMLESSQGAYVWVHGDWSGRRGQLVVFRHTQEHVPALRDVNRCYWEEVKAINN